LRKYCGSQGRPLGEATSLEDAFSLLPSYALRKGEKFPDWKVKYIRKNRQFYEKHKDFLDEWKTKIIEFPPSFQKLEWNCQGEADRKLTSFWCERDISH
jgi:DNA (cytosine-5)-methyltransferase 1